MPYHRLVVGDREQARNKSRNAKIGALEQREKEAREAAAARRDGLPVKTQHDDSSVLNAIREKSRLDRERLAREAQEVGRVDCRWGL